MGIICSALMCKPIIYGKMGKRNPEETQPSSAVKIQLYSKLRLEEVGVGGSKEATGK